MIRKIVLALAILAGTLVAAEVIGLVLLYRSVSTYGDYWKGRANQSGEFLYVAVGDSAAQAIGASKPDNGYVGRMADYLAEKTGRRVRVVNLSVTGATLGDALKTQVPELNGLKADFVTVEIGANDMVREYDKATFGEKYEKLLQALPPGRAVVSDMPYFGTRPQYNDDAIEANHQIRGLARQYGVPVANLFEGLRQNQSPLIYAVDLFHPNDRGYSIWYNAFRQVTDQQVDLDTPQLPDGF